MKTQVAIAVNWHRPDAISAAKEMVKLLSDQGADCYVVDESHSVAISNCQMLKENQLPKLDCLLVIGGDGTILRSAEIARNLNLPLLGINHGHVGFLAEAESTQLTQIAQAISRKNWEIEERITLEVQVVNQTNILWESWALNEISIEKASNSRIVELVTAVDDQPVSRYAGDGVIVATPTGSTAYAFSAGGPVVWPNVNAVVLVPLSAHSLFARPLVLDPQSTVVIDLISEASAWADSRRGGDLPAGARVIITKSTKTIKLMRLSNETFTNKLVAKFNLPTLGWRGSKASK